MAPGFPRSCAVCGDDNVKLMRFALVTHSTKPDGRPTSRGCGSIDLCLPCWTTSKLFARLTTPLIRSAARAVA